MFSRYVNTFAMRKSPPPEQLDGWTLVLYDLEKEDNNSQRRLLSDRRISKIATAE